ncbi:MAG: saccharopine dehydrogenase NADP-binding domain-containing protein [Bacteroidales bacterium]|nr:saccharopine dehydrogenase NADP-binding domain-containing protein [Bacteroidales bacterium]
MKKALILGAGLVVKPMVHYLLDNGIQVTIASRTKSKADAMIKGREHGKALAWTVDDIDTLDNLIAEHDIAVSLLPYAYHPMVAEYCIKHKKPLVTASYVQPKMKALDEEAKNAGVLLLNEIGLDPGIDHMSAMRIIDTVHNKGGKIKEFYSLCGALPAPEAATNPFKYKFSWSPKGVVMAGNNDAKYLKHGKIVEVPTENLFKDIFNLDFPSVGELQVYPNRNSLPYIQTYGIPETSTMFRGTFRYKGWCETLDAIKALGLITNDKKDFTGKTYAEMVAMLIGADNATDIKQKAADYLKIDKAAYALNAIEWLGLFDDKPMNRKEDTTFEITSDLMIEKMQLGGDERDMCIMQHVFLAEYADGKQEVIKSSLMDFGTLNTDTSIARTVALPAAVAVRMILEGKITETGVHIPVIPEIYNPILDALEEMNIKMTEKYGLPVSENIK